jgi:uncharacterized protein YjlB
MSYNAAAAPRRERKLMTIASQRTAPITHLFADDGLIPNNAALPFVLYRGGIDLAGSPDPEQVIEKTFTANGWGGLWRNGIYPYVHYHSMIHEVMGIARGRATVRFGGKKGREIEITSGDVVILPAGTGHQLVTQTQELVVIGAYPPRGKFDLCRGSKADHDKALARIAEVPAPETDPVFGEDGPLIALWGA